MADESAMLTPDAWAELLGRANNDDPEAICQVGMGYLAGNDCVEVDYDQAVLWFQKGVQLDHVKSISQLALMYTQGLGVVQDVRNGITLFKQAAEMGRLRAMYWLGRIYYENKYISPDYQQALEYWKRAAQNPAIDIDVAKAQHALSVYYSEEKACPADYSQMIFWITQAAENGLFYAQARLGELYFDGLLGVGQNYSKAFSWYKRAAEQANETTQRRCGYLYVKGSEEERNAIKSYIRVSTCLSYMYHNGVGTERDYYKAFEWDLKAAEQGDAFAQYYVGYCYLEGVGIDQDAFKAKTWLNRALAEAHPQDIRDKAQELLNSHPLLQS